MTITAQDYFAANPDVASAYSQFGSGMSPDEFAATHYTNYGQAEGRQTSPLTAPSDFNPNAVRAPTPRPNQGREYRPGVVADSPVLRPPMSPNAERANTAALNRQLNSDQYQSRSQLLSLQRQAQRKYDDIAKSLLGDDYRAWQAARLGTPMYSYKDDMGRRQWTPTKDYLTSKFGTSDFNAFMQQKGLPSMPQPGQFSMQQGGQGIQTYRDLLSQLNRFKPQTPGMLTPPAAGAPPTNPNTAPVAASQPLAGMFTGAQPPQASVAPPMASQAPSQTGPYPTVGDSSAWRAAPSAMTPQQRLFS